VIQKSAILPLISVIALVAQLVFHKEIPADIQDNLATIVVNIVLLYSGIKGIFTNHRTPLPEKEKENASVSDVSQYSDSLIP
jgi:uncharacterized membrane protein YfbV (UPF0208 family)